MFLYFTLAILLFFLMVYCTSREQTINAGTVGAGKTALFGFVFLTIILGGIRWETGTDWYPYYNYFKYHNTWDQYNNVGQFEFSYVLLNFLVKKYFGSYTTLLLIISFIVIFLRYRTIKVIALYPVLSYYLFFCDYIGGMFPIRQTIAISIALTSIYFIHKKNKMAFIAITLLAASFHLASIVWFISYPLYYAKLRSSTMIKLLIISMVIGLVGSNLIIWMVEISLRQYGVSGTISTKIQRYILDGYSDGSFAVFRVIGSAIKRYSYVFLFIALRRQMVKYYPYANGLINIYIFANILFSFFAFNEAFGPMARVGTIFLFVEIFLLPVILKILKPAYAKYLMLSLVFIYGLVKLYTALHRYPDLYMPYHSIFG